GSIITPVAISFVAEKQKLEASYLSWRGRREGRCIVAQGLLLGVHPCPVPSPNDKKRRQEIDLAAKRSSRLAFIRSNDAELLHSAAERIGVEAQDFCRASCSINNPTRLVKGGQNVISRVGFQAVERRSSASCRRFLAFGS